MTTENEVYYWFYKRLKDSGASDTLAAQDAKKMTDLQKYAGNFHIPTGQNVYTNEQSQKAIGTWNAVQGTSSKPGNGGVSWRDIAKPLLSPLRWVGGVASSMWNGEPNPATTTTAVGPSPFKRQGAAGPAGDTKDSGNDAALTVDIAALVRQIAGSPQSPDRSILAEYDRRVKDLNATYKEATAYLDTLSKNYPKEAAKLQQAYTARMNEQYTALTNNAANAIASVQASGATMQDMLNRQGVAPNAVDATTAAASQSVSNRSANNQTAMRTNETAINEHNSTLDNNFQALLAASRGQATNNKAAIADVIARDRAAAVAQLNQQQQTMNSNYQNRQLQAIQFLNGMQDPNAATYQAMSERRAALPGIVTKYEGQVSSPQGRAALTTVVDFAENHPTEWMTFANSDAFKNLKSDEQAVIRKAFEDTRTTLGGITPKSGLTSIDPALASQLSRALGITVSGK